MREDVHELCQGLHPSTRLTERYAIKEGIKFDTISALPLFGPSIRSTASYKPKTHECRKAKFPKERPFQHVLPNEDILRKLDWCVAGEKVARWEDDEGGHNTRNTLAAEKIDQISHQCQGYLGFPCRCGLLWRSLYHVAAHLALSHCRGAGLTLLEMCSQQAEIRVAPANGIAATPKEDTFSNTSTALAKIPVGERKAALTEPK